MAASSLTPPTTSGQPSSARFHWLTVTATNDQIGLGLFVVVVVFSMEVDQKLAGDNNNPTMKPQRIAIASRRRLELFEKVMERVRFAFDAGRNESTKKKRKENVPLFLLKQISFNRVMGWRGRSSACRRRHGAVNNTKENAMAVARSIAAPCQSVRAATGQPHVPIVMKDQTTRRRRWRRRRIQFCRP